MRNWQDLAALFIAEELQARRTLVLVPSLSLLSQTLREWSANASEPFEFLPVCSDETVADPDSLTSNVSELGFPVTTDPAEIAAFLRRRGRRVLFSTYQSSPQIEEAYQLGRIPRFDLAIADEAHRCAGRVSKDFGTILDPNAIPARRLLFMTATPRYFTGRLRREAGEAQFEVASMDDEEAFGPVFHRLTFGEAIERDLLSDYRVAVVAVDDATYREWAEQGRFVTRDGEVIEDARTLAGQIGVAKAIAEYDLRRVITFHSRVKKARDFSLEIRDVIDWMPDEERPGGEFWSDFVSGEMPAGDRDIRLGHLRLVGEGERALLSNARCLGEGVDVPALDGVAFVDPRRSEVDIVQAVGRSIRRAGDKTVGTIVIPVFVEETKDPELALDDSTFKPVWDVVKALRSHDEELAEFVDSLRRGLGRGKKRPALPSKIVLEIPLRVGELGSWVTRQRVDKRRIDELPVADRQRLKHLEDLPKWTWNPQDALWEEGLERLRLYCEEVGDADVPQSFSTDDGYHLGSWVSTQRAFMREGKLSGERATALEELPGWVWDPKEALWWERYVLVEKFAEKEGHARVPFDSTVDGVDLGGWVIGQRNAWRKGKIDPGRAGLLESLPGWVWNPHEAAWEDGFAHLERYVAENGSPQIAKSHVTRNGFRLGNWVHNQLNKHHRGALVEDRKTRLEEIPGWKWRPRPGG